MVDTHCHLYYEYYDDLDEIIDKIRKAGIKAVIVNGCDMKTNKEVVELVNKYDIVYGALGFHPTELEKFDDNDFNWLEEHINGNKIVAIGEIGLDYHYDNTDKDKQLYVFKKQLEIAKKYNKPVIVHSRDSIQDTYNILKESKCRGSIHCYSGSLEMAREFIKIGFYLGIGGIVTFNNAKNIIDVIKNIKLEYILMETDSPYLTPEPYRGLKNNPSYLSYILEKISDLKGIDKDVVNSTINDNVKQLFDI